MQPTRFARASRSLRGRLKREPLARPVQKKIVVAIDVETGKISGGQKE
jgi:hypothetical protein